MKKFLIAILVPLALGACALTVDEVDLTYQPLSSPGKIGGAQGMTVKVTGSDARTSNRDRIGVKKNGYGMEMASIVPKQAVADYVTKAVETEISARGFKLGDGSVFILIDVNKFYNDFKMGFLVGEAVGEVMLSVSVRSADGKLLYSRAYGSEGRVGEVMLFTGDNAKEAMEKAFAGTIVQIFEDPYFIQAVVDAHRGMTGAVKGGAPTS